MPFVILPTNSASGGYDITNSLRFNSGSSDYLNRTPASNGNKRTFTFSFWFKISKVGQLGRMFSCDIADTEQFWIKWESNKLNIESNYYALYLNTTQLFRDVSAWYHIVVAFDTTQATNTNRCKVYINGSQVTAFDSADYPSQNTDLQWNGTNVHTIGNKYRGLAEYIDGYMSDAYFIDGQQLTPSSFGETDFDTGIWKPKAYTGTYGTNGFYLQFKNSASLGTDSSGNGNTFTVNNLTSIDQTTDTPTNNFGTLNPLAKNTNTSSSNFSNGNLELISSGSTAPWVGCVNTIAVTKGKWYAEYKVVDAGNPQNGVMIGVTNVDLTNFQNAGNDLQQSGEYGLNYYAGGQILNNGTVATYTAMSDGDIVMIALDIDNGKVYWGRNGTWENSGVPTSGATGTGAQNLSLISTGYTYAFNLACRQNGNVQANFGNPPLTIVSGNADGAGFGNFEYAVPSGYYSLNTKNLATFG
jgi:hypothetical protein